MKIIQNWKHEEPLASDVSYQELVRTRPNEFVRRNPLEIHPLTKRAALDHARRMFDQYIREGRDRTGLTVLLNDLGFMFANHSSVKIILEERRQKLKMTAVPTDRRVNPKKIPTIQTHTGKGHKKSISPYAPPTFSVASNKKPKRRLL